MMNRDITSDLITMAAPKAVYSMPMYPSYSADAEAGAGGGAGQGIDPGSASSSMSGKGKSAITTGVASQVQRDRGARPVGKGDFGGSMGPLLNGAWLYEH